MFEEGMKIRNIHTGERRIIESIEMVNVRSWADLHPVYVLDIGGRYDEKSMEHWTRIE